MSDRLRKEALYPLLMCSVLSLGDSRGTREVTEHKFSELRLKLTLLLGEFTLM